MATDHEKNMTVSSKSLDDTPHFSSSDFAEGQVDSNKPSILHRLNEWIKLKPSEVESAYGKWSNIGKSNAPDISGSR